jgi:Cytosol aminopeptidase family, catalytic domain
MSVLAVSHQTTRKIALVGKTVCFDTGGYNLKVGLAPPVAPCSITATTHCSRHPTMHMQSDEPPQMHMQTSGGIEYMKMDMCGGAAVLGAAESISLIRPEGVEARPALETAPALLPDSRSYGKQQAAVTSIRHSRSHGAAS